MKLSLALTVACFVCTAVPARAQFGSLSDRLKQAQEAQPGAEPGAAAAGGAKPKDDVVDAEFTEVDDDKNNKKSA